MKIPKIVKNIVNKVDEEINEVKDPICGMKVNLEKQSLKALMKARNMGSALQNAKPSLIRSLINTQKQIVKLSINFWYILT